jgi:MTH538 TIR-like domain (DUF1863)
MLSRDRSISLKRRVFISYQHEDHGKAAGFDLMRRNPNVDLDITCRRLLQPVDSNDKDYISRQIREQLTGTSVTVVVIGEETKLSEWVEREIRWSLEKEPPNGIVGLRLTPEAEIPQALTECGAEILEWYVPEDTREFQAAIERAAARSRLVGSMPSGTGGSCGR